DGRTSSMLQTIPLASTLPCFVFNNLTERFIGIVLDVLSQHRQLPIADQVLVKQSRKHRIIKTLVTRAEMSFRPGRSLEACRQVWSRLRLTEMEDGTGRQNQQHAASDTPASSFDR